MADDHQPIRKLMTRRPHQEAVVASETMLIGPDNFGQLGPVAPCAWSVCPETVGLWVSRLGALFGLAG